MDKTSTDKKHTQYHALTNNNKANSIRLEMMKEE